MARLREILKLWERWWFPFALTALAIGLPALLINQRLITLLTRLEGPFGTVVGWAALSTVLLVPISFVVSIIHAYRAAKKRHGLTALLCAICALITGFLIAMAVLYFIGILYGGH